MIIVGNLQINCGEDTIAKQVEEFILECETEKDWETAKWIINSIIR